MRHPTSHRVPNLALIGPSNNGKTMILENFVRRNSSTGLPRSDVTASPKKPVFMFQAPPEPDEGRLYRKMLTDLYADFAGNEREPADSKLKRLVQILRGLDTRIILIDEFGFLQAGTPMKQQKVLNALKYLGNELKIPMVIAAVPATLNLLQSDEQVANRFEPLFLPKWRAGDEFNRLLYLAEKALMLRRPSELWQQQLADPLLAESDGIIGNVMELLQLLAIKAIRTKTEQIRVDDLTAKSLRALGWTHPTQRHRYKS
jgi:hypothetical protein